MREVRTFFAQRWMHSLTQKALLSFCPSLGPHSSVPFPSPILCATISILLSRALPRTCPAPAPRLPRACPRWPSPLCFPPALPLPFLSLPLRLPSGSHALPPFLSRNRPVKLLPRKPAQQKLCSAFWMLLTMMMTQILLNSRIS